MGTGAKEYEDFLKVCEAKYPNRFKAYVKYSDAIAQKIYAGCDIFLMPSKFEPCGLGQMIAMRYATLPLVRETGGLKDTVIPYNKYTNDGTGFTFDKFEPHALKEVMYLAIDTYNNNKEAFNNLRKNAMKQDYSWSSSAKKYIELYNKITN
jgi:starch synthase